MNIIFIWFSIQNLFAIKKIYVEKNIRKKICLSLCLPRVRCGLKTGFKMWL